MCCEDGFTPQGRRTGFSRIGGQIRIFRCGELFRRSKVGVAIESVCAVSRQLINVLPKKILVKFSGCWRFGGHLGIRTHITSARSRVVQPTHRRLAVSRASACACTRGCPARRKVSGCGLWYRSLGPTLWRARILCRGCGCDERHAANGTRP